MSHQLINHSPDLSRLRNEGFDIEVTQTGYLLIKQVPYVNNTSQVLRGTLICKIDLSGNRTAKPAAHDAYWIGEPPCDAEGKKLARIINSIGQKNLGSGIVASARFSAKANYRDFYHKALTYIGRISGEVTKIDPTAVPQVFSPIADDSIDGIFKYLDTASSRSDIGAINQKLQSLKIAIVGLGGTGSYILDLVAKTWVSEIRLIDGDKFEQHNAFRAPSAASLDDLIAKPYKVDYYHDVYSKMRNHISPYPEYISEENVNLLDSMDFIFICVDKAEPKRTVVDYCKQNSIPFVEVGMGALVNNEQVGGILRTVISTPQNRDVADRYISYDDSNLNDAYATNIQIADLNALNASIAVILWKKHYGVYRDTREAHLIQLSIASCQTIIEGVDEVITVTS